MGLGLLLGGILGGVGSAVEAEQARSDAARQRRRQRSAIRQARVFTGGTTVAINRREEERRFQPGSIVSDELIDSGTFRGPTFLDPVTGERRAGGRVEEILADPLLTSARSFLQGTFDNAADSPLAQDFAKGIRSAQAARGTLFGGAAESAEAGGLAAFAQRLRQDLLPSALQFGGLSEQLRQGILGFEAPLRTAAATGGSGLGSGNLTGLPSVFGSALSGALSGGAGGFALDREFGGTESLLSSLGFGGSTKSTNTTRLGSQDATIEALKRLLLGNTGSSIMDFFRR